MNLTTALEHFYNDYIKACENEYGHKPQIEKDNDWPSPCEITGTEKVNLIQWQPVLQNPKSDFDKLDDALELTLHPSIKEFYSSYYSENIDASHERGRMTLLSVWSEKDVEQLKENIIGHILMKKRLGQTATVFIGLTDEDDLIISINNDSGAVCLEYVGKEPHEVLAPSVSEFVESLTPIC